MPGRSINDLRAQTQWLLPPAMVGVIGLAMTAIATAYVSQTTLRESRARFDRWVHQVQDDIRERIESHVALLRGGAAMMAAEPGLTREQFRAFTSRLDLRERYPGMQGIGYARMFRAQELPGVVAGMRGQGISDFHVWPEHERADYSSILYLEPLDRRNAAAIGYDMFTDPTRRAAMERARDTGNRAASGQVTLVQEIDDQKQAGFLIYVPVYAGGEIPETVEERRGMLLGFVYAPFRADDLLRNVVSEAQQPYVCFEIFDGEEIRAERILHRSHAEMPPMNASFSTIERIDLAGARWTIAFTSTRAFERESTHRPLVMLTLGGGVLATGILVLLARRQTRARMQAEAAAAELMRSQQSLRESEERYRLVNRATNDVVWDLNLVTGELHWNESLKTVFGYDPEEVAHNLAWWEERIHPEDRPKANASLRAAIDSTGSTFNDEYRFRCSDGAYALVLDRGFIIRDARGKAVRMIGSMLDLSERMKSEQQLRQLNETLEQRVAERTKELRTNEQRLRSLAAQLTMTEQRERRRLAQVLHDHLQQLLVAATMRVSLMKRRLEGDNAASAEAVADLLNRSIEASRSLTVELSPPVLYDAGLIAGLRWLAGRMRDKYNLDVEVEADEQAEPGTEEIRVVLFNAVQELLFNIVKHAGVEKAYVTLVRLSPRRVQVTVEDEGRGFEQNAGAEQSVASMGYGLFNLRERLQSIGATLEIESAPGEGTCVQISVPAALETAAELEPAEDESLAEAAELEPQAASAAPAGATPSSGNGHGKIRVLLADDHKILRDGLVSLLREEPDIEVVGEAPDGAVALELARTTQPHLVIMDVTMPNMNGIEATRRISSEMPDIRVIGLSMHDDSNLASAMREAGAVAYLAKDGPSNVLISTIRDQAGSTADN